MTKLRWLELDGGYRATITVVLAAMLIISGFVFLEFIGRAVRARKRVAAIPTSTPLFRPNPQKQSVKMEQMADSVNESFCVELEKKISNPYHDVTSDERAFMARCVLLQMRSKHRGQWEMAKREADKHDAARGIR